MIILRPTSTLCQQTFLDFSNLDLKEGADTKLKTSSYGGALVEYNETL